MTVLLVAVLTERLSRWAERLTRLARGLVHLADFVGACIFAVLFGSLVVQVFVRFVLGAPAAWTEELASIAFVWMIFWGIAFTVPLRMHVAVDLVVPYFAPRARRALYALGLAVLGGCYLWAVPGTADYLRFMTRERTPVLDWPLGIVYSVFLAATVMVVLRCACAILRPRNPSATPGENP